MLRISLNIQLFASKKGVSSTKNGRDSAGRRLGAKAADGEAITSGAIIYRQRGTRIYPGNNVGMGKDHTLFALIDGVVKYERKEKMFQCEYCPCFKECKNLPEEDYSCEDMFFAYITLGKNFDLKREKILKNS